MSEEVEIMLRKRVIDLEDLLREFVYRLNEARRHRDLTPLERKIDSYAQNALRRSP